MERDPRHIIEKEVIDGLSQLILHHLNSAAREEHHPSSDADYMDAQIVEGKKKAAALRAIRENFENTVTGIIMPGERVRP